MVAFGLVSVTLAGCPGGGHERSIEDAAWIAAGADEVTFDAVADGRLTVSVETGLPIDDADDPQRYATRVAQIVWRTHPGPFDELMVTTRHDGATITDGEVFARAGLEATLGPRPAGLDDGVARTPLEPGDGDIGIDWRPLADGTPDDALEMLFEPLLADTAAAYRGERSDVAFERDEPEECMTGLDGQRSTGRFRRSTSTTLILDRAAKPVLVELAEDWSADGLDVGLSTLDAGGDVIDARFDELGSIIASADGHRLRLRATTDCLSPG